VRHGNSFITDQRSAVAKVLTLRGLLADRRGVAAFEFLIVAGFLLFVLLLPIADVGVAALRYMQTKQAMRDLGAFVQYNPPPDLTAFSAATWKTLPANVGAFTVAIGTGLPASETQINITVSCGTPGATAGPACTLADMANLSTPKYVWMGAVINLTPIVLPITGGPLSYTERLQWPQ
jgi:Flp pilus assembly protein TadG